MATDGVHLKVVEDGPTYEVRGGREVSVQPESHPAIGPKVQPDGGLRMPPSKRVEQQNVHLPDHAPQ